MHEPSFEQASAWLRSGKIQPPKGLEAEEAFAFNAKLFAAVFGTPEGSRVLQLILGRTLFQPAVDYTLPRTGEFENYALLREGQNQTAAMIVAYLNHAEDLKESPHGSRDSSRSPAGGGPEPEPDASGSFGVAVS